MNLEIFSDNLERLFDTPNSVDYLRELILTLAIRGKLVPQNPNDEPASKLIIKINSEKEHLITEKKIRSPKLLPPVESHSIQFQIPENWQWVRLGNVGQIVGGGTPKTNHPEYFAENGIPWLTPADLYKLNEKFIIRGKRDISELGLKKSSAQLMPAGTVIFSSRAPIGYVVIASNELATNQGFKSCIPFVMDMNEYIYYFLKFAGKEIDRNASGTTFKEVSGKEVNHILLPLPPLNEQKRIVAKVDQLMSLCDQLEARQQKKHEKRILLNNAALDKLLTAPTPEEFTQHWQRICDNFDLLYDAPETVGQLRQAILQLAVQGKLVAQDLGDEPAAILLEKIEIEREKLVKKKQMKALFYPLDKVKIPYKLSKSWIWTNLANVGRINPRNTSEDEKEVSFIPMTLISEYYKKQIKSEKRQWGEIKNGFTHFAEDDVVMAKITPCFQNCKSAVMHNLINGLGAGTTELHVFRPLLNDSINPEYVLLYLKSPQFLKEGIKKMTGTAGHKRVPKEYFGGNPFPLPPYNEQKRIVAKVDQLMALCDELEAGLVQAQTDGGELMEAVVHHVLAE